jgi:MYXO-CTERM domain-containing protein
MMVHKVSRAGLVLGVVGVSLVAAGGVARAQSLRPNILIIFDTSGSMLSNNNDGSPLCGGNGTNSRIYSLKNALRQALAQAGTDEANIGLMRFPQTTNPMQNPTCSVGHYSNAGTNNGCRFTTDTAGVNGMAAEPAYGAWFDNGIAQSLVVPVTRPAGGLLPTAGTDFDPVDGNIGQIYPWIDLTETAGMVTTITDPELRSPSNNSTPLGRSLFYARLYFDQYVKAKNASNVPVDPKAACRTNLVILATDGDEQCDTTVGTALNNTTCAQTGYATFSPEVQACKLFRNSGVRTYVLTDTTTGAANDRIATSGGTTTAIRVTLTDTNAVKAALVSIIAQTVPPGETCNGMDDNCNGQIDEGVKNMCPLDLTATLKHCAVETANCLDDDCDGLIDEGFPPNACGQGAGCPVPPEVCDGLDNDCDGDIDEGFNVGQSCNNGLTGNCRRIGITECAPDKLSVTCKLTDAPTSTETCNGMDDDCNGMIDDGLGTGQGIGIDCGVQGQGCNKGITRCVGGKVVCEGSSMPTMETCNGRDDDCNGLIDDGVFPGVGDSCLCPGLTQAQVGVGTCRAGRLACKGVEGVKCDGCTLPQPEICNGKDDDCDGMADHMAMCPSGFGCREGACGLQCRAGEFPCPPGYDCVENFCVPNRCKNVSCGIDQKCDNATGSCVDLCYKVTCLTGQTCMRGSCYDCNNSPLLACKADEQCVNRQCVKDKCAGVKCNGDQYCSAGKCLTLQCNPACGANQICIQGQCQPFNCDLVSCQSYEYCDFASGTCKTDMCMTKTCAFCAKETGECTPDPCKSVKCPADGCWACAVTPTGEPYCQLGTNCGYQRVLAGNTGGGCSCEVANGSGLPAGLGGMALMGLALIITRQQRRQSSSRRRRL